MFRIAFYKGTRPGIEGLYSRAVRVWTRSPYSHCEFNFSNGSSASSSFLDGGVRIKDIEYNPDNWDFIELPEEIETECKYFIYSNLGKPYDILGNLGFILPTLDPASNSRMKPKYFCSEILAAALGFERPELFSPGLLYYALKRQYG